jgi:hypothetical protein
MMDLFQVSPLNPGDHKRSQREDRIKEIGYTIHKFNNRPRPRSKNIVIFPIFSEFGSETVIPLVCLPKLLTTKYQGKYSIVVGWPGREYLYRHLVDEFWEIDESCIWLREYCRCFHHDSKNLKEFEQKLTKFGHVVDIGEISNLTVFPVIRECPVSVNNYVCKGQVIQLDSQQLCSKCGMKFDQPGCFFDILKAKKEVIPLPMPSIEKVEKARAMLPPNAVGIVGRARKCYGRNLGTEFYKRLCYLVEDLGYNVVWMGEKGVSLPKPCDHIFDFTSHPDAKDFEFALAAVSLMRFTIQFWTASTRLAGFVGTPFLLFESPDQIWGVGHEGYRLNLCSRGPKKVVAAHFLNVLENQSLALSVVKDSIYEMEQGNYRPKIGLVNDTKVVRNMIVNNNLRVGFLN